MKKCRKCGLVAEEVEFPSAGWTKGKQYRRNICMTCYWQHVKKPRRDANVSWYVELKKQKTCKDCGNADYRVLEFHHLDSELKCFNMSDAVSTGVGRERLLEELEKCECLCANCHRIRTWETHNQAVVQLG